MIRTAATEILLPVASREFEILANLRVAISSGADISRMSRLEIFTTILSRGISSVARQSLWSAFLARESRLSELALWAAVALCSFLVAQLLEDRG